MESRIGRRGWAALNGVGLVVTLVMNGLANGLPLGGRTTGELSDLYPNLFVPAGLTFSIWGVIYLLLIGLVGAQLVAAFRGAPGKAVSDSIDAIGPWFGVSSLANSLWIVAWHFVYPAVSLLLMLVLLTSLLVMYLRLKIGMHDAAGARRWFVELPISVYLGWITVATIANVTSVLVSWDLGDLPPGPVFWTVTVIVAAIVIAAAMIVRRHDKAFAAVVVWALIGIIIKRRAAPVEGDASIVIVAAVGIAALVVLAVGWTLRERRSTS